MVRLLSIAFFVSHQLFALLQPYQVGQRDYVFYDSLRNRKVPGHVWYPINPTKTVLPVEEKTGQIFIPVLSANDAPLAKTPPNHFPVVLLSHGTLGGKGGTSNRLFWFTQFLVQRGNIVVGVEHPGNTTADSSAAVMVRVWDRAQDISLALDRLLDLPEFQGVIDTSRIAAAGHSVGGTAVLLLAGARLSVPRFSSPAPLCAGSKDPYFTKQCEELRSIDFKSFPPDTVRGNYTNPRIKAVIAFDPGFVRSFQNKPFTNLKAKTYLFIADKLSTPQDEIYSKEFLAKFPSGTGEIVPHSNHFTFLNPCKPELVTKTDPEIKRLCADNSEKLRMQKDIAEKSLAFFQQSWTK